MRAAALDLAAGQARSVNEKGEASLWRIPAPGGGTLSAPAYGDTASDFIGWIIPGWVPVGARASAQRRHQSDAPVSRRRSVRLPA